MADGRNGHTVNINPGGWPHGRKSIAEKACSLFLSLASLEDDAEVLLSKFVVNVTDTEDRIRAKIFVCTIIIGSQQCLKRHQSIWRLDPCDPSDLVLFITYTLLQTTLPPNITYPHTQRETEEELTPQVTDNNPSVI